MPNLETLARPSTEKLAEYPQGKFDDPWENFGSQTGFGKDCEQYNEHKTSYPKEPKKEAPNTPSACLPEADTHLHQTLLNHIQIQENAPAWLLPLLQRISMHWQNETLLIQPSDCFTAQRLEDPETQGKLLSILKELGYPLEKFSLNPATFQRKDRTVLRQEILNHPFVQALEELFQARLVDFGQLH